MMKRVLSAALPESQSLRQSLRQSHGQQLGRRDKKEIVALTADEMRWVTRRTTMTADSERICSATPARVDLDRSSENTKRCARLVHTHPRDELPR